MVPVPKIKTSARQDIRMILEILRVSLSRSVAAFGLSLHLRAVGDILDGKPLEYDSSDFQENIRLTNFGRYVDTTLAFLLATKLCKLDRNFIDAGVRAPTEISYMRVTRLGQLFNRSPYPVQWTGLKILKGLLFIIEALKRYRWIFSVVSMTAGAFTWAKTHDLSALSLAVAVAIGALAAITVAWLANFIDLSGDA